MYWMFEPHSKDYYYDDALEGGEPTTGCLEILLFPFHLILVMLTFAIFDVFLSLIPFVYGFYEIAKDVSESGKLEFPNLTYIGIWTGIIFPVLIRNNVFNVSEHPFITFFTLLFVIFFNIAPLTGLIWGFFKKINKRWSHEK